MKRIEFLEKTRGTEAAVSFAREVIVSYRQTVLKYGRALIHRPEMIRTYCAYKRYLQKIK